MKKLLLILFVIIHSNSFAQKTYNKIIEEGLQLLVQQNIPEAIKKYRQAYNINPTKVEANYGLGIAYLYNCQSKGIDCFTALTYLNTAIEIDDTYRNCYYNRGSLKNMMLNYKEAIKDLDIAIARKPYDSARYINIAFSYENLNDTINECKNLKKAAELNNIVAKNKMLKKGCK